MTKTKTLTRKKFSLDQLRAGFQKDNSPAYQSDNGDSPFLKFWEMPTGSAIEVRILPDKDDNNAMMFSVAEHKHSFKIGDKSHWFTCNKHQHGQDCPACEASAAQYALKTDDGKTHGRNLYKNTKHIIQVLVLSYPSDETVEGTIKFMSISANLMNQIKEELADVETVPFDFDEGLKLKISKGTQGEYASYTARFVGKPTALTDDEYNLYESDGVELKTLLPEAANVEDVQKWTDGYIDFNELSAD